MSRDQAEIAFPEYALAYLRYLAGERTTVPRRTEPEQFRGIGAKDAALVRARVRELVVQADLSR